MALRVLACEGPTPATHWTPTSHLWSGGRWTRWNQKTKSRQSSTNALLSLQNPNPVDTHTHTHTPEFTVPVPLSSKEQVRAEVVFLGFFAQNFSQTLKRFRREDKP